MKTIIYYFSGTGNSLAVAKKIAGATGNCELAPIASLMNSNGDITPEADRVGIVCPVYFCGLPVMMATFAGRLDLASVPYVFAVVTHGGGGGSAALKQIHRILLKRQVSGLDAGFSVSMPGNYILMYSAPERAKQEEILAKADDEIDGIIGPVTRCEKHPLPSSLVLQLLYTLIYPWFRSHVHTNDRKFTVTDSCTSCGICAAVCPAGNITIEDKKPVWKHHCELCCGCIHLCPAGAIQAGKKTGSRLRYRNPAISLTELKLRSDEKT